MPAADAYDSQAAASELFMDLADIELCLNQLRRKQNIILQGPPRRPEKTFAARRLAWPLMGQKRPGPHHHGAIPSVLFL